MQESRKLSRWQVNKKAKIKLSGALSGAPCLVKDINFNGMRVVLNFKLTLDSYVNFSLALSEDISIAGEAWVAWHKQAEGRNTYGLLFTKMTDADKENIYKFTYRSAPQEISRLQGIYASQDGNGKIDDRRIFQRFNIRFPVRLLNLNNGEEVAAETSDISAKGIGVSSKGKIDQDTPLEAWLEIPDRGEPLYTRGNVVWSRPGAAGDFRLGIDLERADLLGFSRALRI